MHSGRIGVWTCRVNSQYCVLVHIVSVATVVSSSNGKARPRTPVYPLVIDMTYLWLERDSSSACPSINFGATKRLHPGCIETTVY